MKYTFGRFIRIKRPILSINGHQDLTGFENLQGLKSKKQAWKPALVNRYSLVG